MKVRSVQLARLLAIPVGLMSLAASAHAQLMLKGNIESEITALSTSGGASFAAKYAVTPPGYNNTGSVNHNGAGILTSAFTLQAKKSTGSATLLYRPSNGTANPTNAFAGIQSLDTLGLGSLRLNNTSLASNGTVNFLWTVDFASLQVFDGATAVTSLFTNVPIFAIPLTLSLQHAGNVATLALATPYNAATMFDSLVTLDHGFQIGLSPATTLTTLINSLSTGAFTSNPSTPKSFGTFDVVPIIMSPVPEASTFALWACALLLTLVGVRRLQRNEGSTSAA